MFSKPLFYLILPVAEKRRRSGKEEEEEEKKTKVEALFQLRHQAPVSYITDTLNLCLVCVCVCGGGVFAGCLYEEV